ncbi:hypothetical protein, partial [Scytonema sp. NUACC26]|uniref:hypothetical protein n=1 Tax=Scytonema sp. NUACC26 TaxID=3140176 RepID=UPI0038B2B5A3
FHILRNHQRWLMMKVSVLCSSATHPVYPHLLQWVERAAADHKIELVEKKSDLTGGDILFLISCHEIILPDDRKKYSASLVIHASDLPEGRGWSPHIWQIVEGRNRITVSLIEAQDPVDSGAIWAQRHLVLEGHELCDEINAKLFAIELELMNHALAEQFDLLRVADPDRFPAFFDLRGHRYLVRIEKAGAPDE